MVFEAVRQAVPLAPRDAEFVFNDGPGHRSQLMAVYFFDAAEAEPPSRARLLAWMADRLATADLFTRRLVRVPLAVGYPFWVHTTPDLERHVHTAAADRPGWAGVEEYLAPVLTREMDLTVPPWELHVLTGVADVDGLPAGTTVVALKIHHSAADGLAVRDITLRLFGAGDGEQADAARTVGARPASAMTGTVPTVAVTAALAARSLLGLPGALVRFRRGLQVTGAAGERVARAEADGELAAIPGRANAPVNTPADDPASIRRVRLDRAGVRAVRAAVPGATVNDVYLGVVGRALALHLEEVGEPDFGTLVALVPRSVRGILDWDSANMLELLKIDTCSTVDAPLERVELIAAAAREAKVRADHPDVRLLNTRIETSPAPLLALVGRVRRLNRRTPDGRRQAHTMISNIPLVVAGCRFFGAPAVLGLGTQPPVDGDGARHFLTAAADGGFEIAVVSGANAIADPDRYAERLTEVFGEMVAAAQPR